MALRNIDRLLARYPRNAELRAAFEIDEGHRDTLVRLGFEPPFDQGQTVLPPANIGPSAKFNSQGREVIRRDLPQEEAFRQVYWEWTEWHGRDKVLKSDVRERAYVRYQRETVPP